MIRYLISILFFLSSLLAFGQQTLVDNIDGQWLIYNNGERHFLDKTFRDLGNFDEFGFTYFLRHDKYGIINKNGEVLVEEKYSSAKQLGGGYYLFQGDKRRVLASSTGGEFEFREISRHSKLEESWSIIGIDTNQLLFNTRNGKEWEMGPNDKIYESQFNYVFGEIGDSLVLLDPSGISVNTSYRRPVFGENYLLIQSPTEKKIIYGAHEIQFPNDARSIRVRENEIQYTQDGRTTLISCLDGKVITIFPYEIIIPYGSSTFSFRENGRVGLISKSGEILVDSKYNSITKTGNLYSVRSSNGAGIIDQNGQQLVPCSYDYVRVYSDFFTVHSNLDLVGVVSRKTRKTLLPCTYSSIMLSDTVIRAFASDMLRILELDSNHRIVNDLVLTNVTSLVDTKASTDAGIDKRLFPLGWFIEGVPQYDKEGFRSGEVIKWGLKSASDSILKSPKFKEPLFVENADFSLLPTQPKNISLFGEKKNRLPQFDVTSVQTGRSLVPEKVMSLDTTDLLTRSYSRFISSKGYGILLSDNSILRVKYFDSHDPEYLRFCTSKENEIVPMSKSDYDKVQMPDYNMNNDPEKVVSVAIKGDTYQWVRFLGAEWNFLDTTGKQVFSEPFDYVEPYKFKTAIVSKKGRQGLVRGDSLVIPTNFTSVKRSPITDTLFIVKKKSNRLRYLDTNGRLMPKEMSRFHKNMGELTQVQWNKKKVLISSDYKVISGDTKFQKLMENDIFYSKENKKYTIYDAEGHQLGKVPLKPEEIWFDEYALVKSRGKKGILSVDGDTVVPFRFKKIRKVGSYIFAQGGGGNLLFNNRFEEIRNLKANDILVDSITGQFAEIKENKATIYSSEGKKLRSAKGTEFEYFHNGCLIEMSRKLRVFTPGKTVVLDFEPKTLEVMAENGYLIEDANKTFHYLDENWNEVQFKEPLKRVKYVGAGLAFARSKTQSLLFGGDVNISFDFGTKNDGTYQSGFLLVRSWKKLRYLNTDGINEFNSTFEDARPFKSNYATVKESGGWTIIDRNGDFQILPNFDQITSVSPTIFSTRAQPVYGLFDSYGNELIPAEFQQLFFLRNNVIQGRKDGDIFYFDIHGNPIVLE